MIADQLYFQQPNVSSQSKMEFDFNKDPKISLTLLKTVCV